MSVAIKAMAAMRAASHVVFAGAASGWRARGCASAPPHTLLQLSLCPPVMHCWRRGVASPRRFSTKSVSESVVEKDAAPLQPCDGNGPRNIAGSVPLLPASVDSSTVVRWLLFEAPLPISDGVLSAVHERHGIGTVISHCTDALSVGSSPRHVFAGEGRPLSEGRSVGMHPTSDSPPGSAHRDRAVEALQCVLGWVARIFPAPSSARRVEWRKWSGIVRRCDALGLAVPTELRSGTLTALIIDSAYNCDEDESMAAVSNLCTTPADVLALDVSATSPLAYARLSVTLARLGRGDAALVAVRKSFSSVADGHFVKDEAALRAARRAYALLSSLYRERGAARAALSVLEEAHHHGLGLPASAFLSVMLACTQSVRDAEVVRQTTFAVVGAMGRLSVAMDQATFLACMRLFRRTRDADAAMRVYDVAVKDGLRLSPSAYDALLGVLVRTPPPSAVSSAPVARPADTVLRLMIDQGIEPTRSVRVRAVDEALHSGGVRAAALCIGRVSSRTLDVHLVLRVLRALARQQSRGLPDETTHRLLADVVLRALPGPRMFRALIAAHPTAQSILGLCARVDELASLQVRSLRPGRADRLARVAGRALAASDGGSDAVARAIDDALGASRAGDRPSLSMSAAIRATAVLTVNAPDNAASACLLRAVDRGRFAGTRALSPLDYAALGCVMGIAGNATLSSQRIIGPLVALSESKGVPDVRRATSAACARQFVSLFVGYCRDWRLASSVLLSHTVASVLPLVAHPYERLLAVMAAASSADAGASLTGGSLESKHRELAVAASSVLGKMLSAGVLPTTPACAGVVGVLAEGGAPAQDIVDIVSAVSAHSTTETLSHVRLSLAAAFASFGRVDGIDVLLRVSDESQRWQLAASALSVCKAGAECTLLDWFAERRAGWALGSPFVSEAHAQALRLAARVCSLVPSPGSDAAEPPGRMAHRIDGVSFVEWYLAVANLRTLHDDLELLSAGRHLASIVTTVGGVSLLESAVRAIAEAYGDAGAPVPEGLRRAATSAVAARVVCGDISSGTFGWAASLLRATDDDLSVTIAAVGVRHPNVACELVMHCPPGRAISAYALQDIVHHGISMGAPRLDAAVLALAESGREIKSFVWNAALNAAVERLDGAAVERVREAMGGRGMDGDDVTHNILVKHYARSGQTAALEAMLDGKEVSPIAYTEAIAVHASEGEWDQAKRRLDDARRRLGQQLTFEPYAVLASALLDSAGRALNAVSPTAHVAPRVADDRETLRHLRLAAHVLEAGRADGIAVNERYWSLVARCHALLGAPGAAIDGLCGMRAALGHVGWADPAADRQLGSVLSAFAVKRDAAGLMAIVAALRDGRLAESGADDATALSSHLDPADSVQGRPARRRIMRVVGPMAASAIVQCLARADRTRDASVAFEALIEAGHTPDVRAVTALAAGMTVGSEEALRGVLAAAEGAGCVLDGRAYAPLVSLHAKRGAVSAALRVLEEMGRSKISPTPISYSLIVNACGLSGDSMMALRLARVLCELPPDARDGLPTAEFDSHVEHAWASVVRAHCECGDIDGARRAMAEARGRNVRISNAARTFVITCLAHKGDVAGALAELDSVEHPDLPAFNAALRAAGKVGDGHSADALLVRMRMAGVRGDAATYSMVARARSIGGSPEGALGALREAIADGVQPDSRLVAQVERALVLGNRQDLLSEARRLGGSRASVIVKTPTPKS